MSIQIITGFSLNSTEPIDTRIVASGSNGRDAIPYKYEGLRVFDLSNNRPYVYVGATWSVEINDQLSGSTGSIPRFISSNLISDSNIYQVGTKIGIDTTDPKEALQIGKYPAGSGQSLPLTFHKGGSTVIGYNWYYTSSNQYFDSSVGSSAFVFGPSGDIAIQNKAGGPGILKQSFYISPSGKVGIGEGFGILSQPVQSLQINGTVSATGFIGSGSGLSVGSALTASNVIISPTTTNATHYLTFVSSGAWSSTTAATNIKANTAGISYNPSTNALSVGRAGIGTTNPSSKLTVIDDQYPSVRVESTHTSGGLRYSSIYLGAISSNQGGDIGFAYNFGTPSNSFFHITPYGSVQGTPFKIRSTGYNSANLEINGVVSSTGFISPTGLLTVNSNIKHVSPTFSSPGNVPSFTIGTGNLARTTQITISSVTFDRVIYVYSTSNSNFYYSTSGFFEIEIYIINGVLNQQIFTIFHGNDSDIRPTGFGHNYILPAGCSSTISLYKGNTVSWNTGTTGPTIYATSLKFGL